MPADTCLPLLSKYGTEMGQHEGLYRAYRQIADGDEWKMPATIDDPAILDEITEALKKMGYAQ